MHNGKSVYKQLHGENYLYYWPQYKAWRVGKNYTQADAGIGSASEESAACPTQATDWYQFHRGSWTQHQTIPATCAGDQHVPLDPSCPPPRILLR